MPPEAREDAPRILRENVGTWNRRYEVALADGARVESVLYRDDTLCLSTQVGCAVGCPFCASGERGLDRPLRFDELVAQVALVEARGHALRRATLSGIGEPLHNPGPVLEFLAWARSRGLGVSLTTSGGPLARLRELVAAPHNGLTVSVHAGTEAVRARLVPKGPALEPLFATLAETAAGLGTRRRKKLALAYLVAAGANDGDEEVAAFIARAHPLGLAVHLYALNPTSSSPYDAVGRARYEAIYGAMVAAGLRVRMSSKARTEANGGCGTLVPRIRRRESDFFA